MAANQAAPPPGKTWMFTLNNWTPEELDNILHWDVKRMAVAEEIAPETGTPHLQGRVTFTRNYRLLGLKKMLSRAHWEPAIVEDWNYEHKDGTKVHRIDNRRQGKRRDLDAAYEELAKPGPVRSVYAFAMAERPSFQALKVYEKLLHESAGPRPIPEDKFDIRWYYGPTGSGKSHDVYAEFPEVYRVLTHKWWDGYRGQATVLVDDFRAGWCKFDELLRLTDKYPFRVEFKGGSCEVQFGTLIITSPLSPQEAWEAVGEDVGQLRRRLSVVRRYNARGNWDEVRWNEDLKEYDHRW